MPVPLRRFWRPQQPRVQAAPEIVKWSADERPWNHPFLTRENIARFRGYSERVWEAALQHARRRDQDDRRPLRCAFAVNLAQNMYNWARLASRLGVDSALFTATQDGTAISLPEWEEFDGEFGDVLNGAGFLEAHPDIPLQVPCFRIAMGDSGLLSAFREFSRGRRRDLLRLMAGASGLRHEVLLAYASLYPYFDWARALSDYDVIYAASVPLAAYLSGRPYCAFSVGGDLQFDCGRGDDFGAVMTLAFNAARFLFISNPHALGHCRRLGLTNGIYVPYPIDEDRYAPGEGLARREWVQRHGEGVYVFSPVRLDPSVKGQDEHLIASLAALARRRPAVRFVFLTWGHNAAEARSRLQAAGLGARAIFLPTVGKQRLIDYYRSCDIALDHFVYGYYGATALEAAAIGKPVVMKLRAEQYQPLYAGDVMPATPVESSKDVGSALEPLVDSADLRQRRGRAMRDWLVRNHGRERAGRLMVALLGMAADRVALPREIGSPPVVQPIPPNPLTDPERDDERDYHQACLKAPS